MWGWFWALSARRTHGMSGPNPITFSEIEAWSRLMGANPRPWEVWLITRLDDALRTKKHADPEKNEPPAGEGPEAVSALMMTLGRIKRSVQPKSGGAGGGGKPGKTGKPAADNKPGSVVTRPPDTAPAAAPPER